MGRAIGRKSGLYFDAEDSARRRAAYKAESDYERGNAYALVHKMDLSHADKCEIGKHFRLGKFADSLPPRLRPPARRNRPPSMPADPPQQPPPQTEPPAILTLNLERPPDRPPAEF